MIEFDDAGKVYPDGTVALSSLRLTAPTGEITVLVGPSGCGKTTSLRMVNRMVEPTSGRVLLDGADVAGRDPAELRRGIGYVIQHAGLFPHRTVLDNVATVPVLQGATRREARRRAAEVIERVGLDTETTRRYPAQLSGGQQQRVGVARALAGDAPVLLMDEPFSAVDPIVRADLQAELLRLQAEDGRTVVFVTHDIDEALRLGDHIAILRTGGVLAQFATPGRLLAAPADEFVAAFVGQDRGYRRLGFVDAGALSLTPLPTAAADGAWRLIVDAQGRPSRWRAPDGGVRATGALHTVTGPGGSAGSLRSALDAALSSPAGVGVAVDADGRALGGIDPEHVLALLADHRDGSP